MVMKIMILEMMSLEDWRHKLKHFSILSYLIVFTLGTYVS